MKTNNPFQKNIKALVITATLAFVLALFIASQKTNACVTYDPFGNCVDVGTTDTSNGSLDPFAVPSTPAVDTSVPTVDPYATDPNAVDYGATTPSGDPYTACLDAGGDAASCGDMPGDPSLSTSGSSADSGNQVYQDCMASGGSPTYCATQPGSSAPAGTSGTGNKVYNDCMASGGSPTYCATQPGSSAPAGTSGTGNKVYNDCMAAGHTPTYCAGQTGATAPRNSANLGSQTIAKPAVPAAAAAGSGSNTTYAKITNPLQANTIGEIVSTGTSIFSYTVVLFGVLALIYTGLQYVLAQGNAEKVKELKTQLLWIVIGIAIVIGARIIVSVVINTLSATGIVSPNVINSAESANSSH